MCRSTNMLDKIRGKYPSSKIAIVASAPSALRYIDEGYQATIGVNGGGQLLDRSIGDKYFFSADILAPYQSWYLKNPPNTTQIIRTLAAVFSTEIYLKTKEREKAIRYVEEYLKINNLDNIFYYGEESTFVHSLSKKLRNLTYMCPLHQKVFERFPPPKNANVVLFTVNPYVKINQSMKELVSGGTSSGGALQIAFLMGATEIHLYGVEFTNQSDESYGSKNYFYKYQRIVEGGHTDEKQQSVMEKLIRTVKSYGVKVFHHGPTKLKNLIILE